MYDILRTKKFAKSLARMIRGGLKKSVQKEILCAIEILASGNKLDRGYCDHKLKGEFSGYRECHIQGDLLLIYKIENKELILVLVDIGTHSDLF